MTPRGLRLRDRAVFWTRASAGALGFGAGLLWFLLMGIARVPNATRRQSFARLIARLCLPPAGIRATVVGVERMRVDEPCIYVSNHQSQIDYPLVGLIYPGRALVMASQIGDWPVMGWMFRSSGSIEVDRKNPLRAAGAVDQAVNAIAKRGLSVWVFAEGTRGKIPGTLGRFKRGAFRLAAATGRPIVPVVISPLKPYTDLRGRRLQPHEVTIRILDPVYPKGPEREDEDALRDEVRSRMLAVLQSMSPRTPHAEQALGPINESATALR